MELAAQQGGQVTTEQGFVHTPGAFYFRPYFRREGVGIFLQLLVDLIPKSYVLAPSRTPGGSKYPSGHRNEVPDRFGEARQF